MFKHKKFTLIITAVLVFFSNSFMYAESINDEEVFIKNGSRDKKLIALTFDDGPHPKETNQVLANQQRTIETAKRTIKTAVDMGCKTKEEISNISTQITEHNTTNDNQKKSTIEQSISSFQQSKGISNGYTETKGQAYQLKRTNNANNNNGNNSNHGFVNVITLSLVVTFVIGIAIGIGYMLFKLSIGG